jgi:hypothetical protein
VVEVHRVLNARKFKARIDYVDLTAFGVNLPVDDNDNFALKSKHLAEEIQQYTSIEGRLTNKLKKIDDHLKNYFYSVSAMAMRYDQRMKEVIINGKCD